MIDMYNRIWYNLPLKSLLGICFSYENPDGIDMPPGKSINNMALREIWLHPPACHAGVAGSMPARVAFRL